MSRLESILDRLLMTMVTRLPGYAVAAIALLLYAGGLVLPITLHWSVVGLVEANLLGTTFAGLVGIGWLLAQLQARDRRHLVEWTSDLRLLGPEEFEWLIGEVFHRERWRVDETGHQDRGDGNIDLKLTREGQHVIVQCKRWVAWSVGVAEIREFAGTLLREGLAGSAGIFVTLSDFTEPARAEARTMGMTLVDRRELHSRIEKVRRAELCGICRQPMLLDRSSRGWWFRCVRPHCQGKRDLSSDPGRAVDLLTQPPDMAEVSRVG